MGELVEEEVTRAVAELVDEDTPDPREVYEFVVRGEELHAEHRTEPDDEALFIWTRDTGWEHRERPALAPDPDAQFIRWWRHVVMLVRQRHKSKLPLPDMPTVEARTYWANDLSAWQYAKKLVGLLEDDE